MAFYCLSYQVHLCNLTFFNLYEVLTNENGKAINKFIIFFLQIANVMNSY